MPHKIPLKPARMALFGLLISIVACNTSTTKDTAAKSEESAADSVAPAPNDESLLHIRGKFDTLYVSADTILTLDSSKRMVFCYTFKKGQGNRRDSLTMHGWPNKQQSGDEDFDPKPKVVLQNGNTGNIPFSPGTYFENVVIKAKALDNLMDSIRKKQALYVLFAPTDTSTYFGHIYYKILLLKENPVAPFKALAPIPTDQIANPSPPRKR